MQKLAFCFEVFQQTSLVSANRRTNDGEENDQEKEKEKKSGKRKRRKRKKNRKKKKKKRREKRERRKRGEREKREKKEKEIKGKGKSKNKSKRTWKKKDREEQDKKMKKINSKQVPPLSQLKRNFYDNQTRQNEPINESDEITIEEFPELEKDDIEYLNSVQMDPKALNIFIKFQTAPKPSAKNSRILILSKLFWISNPSATPEEGRGLFEALKEPKPYPDIRKWFQNNRSRFKQAIVGSYIQSSNISNYDYYIFFLNNLFTSLF